MEKTMHERANKFFDSFCSAMKVGSLDEIMAHYAVSDDTVQILSNGQIIIGYENIKREYSLFLEEVEMLEFQVPMFRTVETKDHVLMILQLHGMARVRKSRVKLPYRGSGSILVSVKGDELKMVCEHFTLRD